MVSRIRYLGLSKRFLKDNSIAFISMDCDIYSSTKDVFKHLGDNIVNGTLILFDDYYNYPGYEGDEYRALQEFLEATGKKAEYVAYNANGEQVLVRILDGPDTFVKPEDKPLFEDTEFDLSTIMEFPYKAPGTGSTGYKRVSLR